jgi:hypothetical protein
LLLINKRIAIALALFIVDTMAIITVTNSNDSGPGSLRAALAAASAGDTINFAPSVTTIDLDSSLVISKNVTIEGSQPGSTTPGVTVNGGGSTSNFSDFVINAGVTAKIDGLIIADGNAVGAAGSAASAGGDTAGGIFDAGALTLSDSVLEDDTATGGAGGNAGSYHGGGAGGNAAGGIYVSATGSLDLLSGDAFSNDSATGGHGGSGGAGMAFHNKHSGGAGGAGGISGVNGGVGSSGTAGAGFYGGAGGAPGQHGTRGGQGPFLVFGPGGGGGGGRAFGDVGGDGKITGDIPCYCAGTLIATKDGDKRVEDLSIGDEIVTLSGALRPIKWIGRRSYGGRFVQDNKSVLPVCIKAGALDDNVPKRDLWISPHHAMYVDGMLIEAKDLINATSIVQAERAETIEYFHVELETHDVIIAEGALSETYLDDDNRAMFHNARDYDALYPTAAAVAPYCAPRLEDGYEVERVRQRIALRAGSHRATSGGICSKSATRRVTSSR